MSRPTGFTLAIGPDADAEMLTQIAAALDDAEAMGQRVDVNVDGTITVSCDCDICSGRGFNRAARRRRGRR